MSEKKWTGKMPVAPTKQITDQSADTITRTTVDTALWWNDFDKEDACELIYEWASLRREFRDEEELGEFWELPENWMKSMLILRQLTKLGMPVPTDDEADELLDGLAPVKYILRHLSFDDLTNSKVKVGLTWLTTYLTESTHQSVIHEGAD
jgi:hypothetical protein